MQTINESSHFEEGPALHTAVSWGRRAGTARLLKNGADVNARDSDGQTALHIAAMWDISKLIPCLLKYGVDVNARDSNGQTALHTAVLWDSRAIIAILLKNGADVHAQDSNGRTALHLAAANGKESTVRYLCNRGTNIECVDHEGKTALYYLIEYYSAIDMSPGQVYGIDMSLAQVKLMAEIIHLFLEKGAFLFHPLHIKESKDALPKSIRLYDRLPPVLQGPIKAYYLPLIEQALQANAHLKHTVAKLPDKQSRDVLTMAFIEAQQALPRLLKQPSVGRRKHLATEIWQKITSSLPTAVMQVPRDWLGFFKQPPKNPKNLKGLPEELWLEVVGHLLMALGIDPEVAPILAPEALARIRAEQNNVTGLPDIGKLSLR